MRLFILSESSRHRPVRTGFWVNFNMLLFGIGFSVYFVVMFHGKSAKFVENYFVSQFNAVSSN